MGSAWLPGTRVFWQWASTLIVTCTGVAHAAHISATPPPQTFRRVCMRLSPPFKPCMQLLALCEEVTAAQHNSEDGSEEEEASD